MESQKHLFSLPSDIHYLNCAYKAPLLRTSEEALQKALIRERDPSLFSAADFFDEVEEVKEQFGRIVNAPSSSIALIPSVSYGMATVLNNISAGNNTHALVVSAEFPSGYLGLQRWCHENKCELKVVDGAPEQSSEDWNQRLLDSINEDTAILILSSVHWTNGYKFNLQNIGEKCRKHGVKFIVDGSQSVGALPMDVAKFNIDALICAAYKWLLGPYATALAYISPEFHQGKPLEEAWRNRSNAKNFSELTNYNPLYTDGASRFDMGEASNFITLPVLKNSLKQLNTWGIENISTYAGEIMDVLYAFMNEWGLQNEKREFQSPHIAGIKLPDHIDQNSLKNALSEEKIFLSQRSDKLRVSVNVFNHKADVEKLCDVITAFTG